MPNCPSCEAQLDDETLVPDETSVCPSCGAAIELVGDEISLSSLIGGSPADATMRIDPGSESSLAGSSLAGSDSFSDELSSNDVEADATIDSGFLGSDIQEPSVEATLPVGGGWADDDNDEDDDLYDTDFEVDDLDTDSEAADEATYTSLDATIDLCNWMPKSEIDLQANDPTDSDDDQTIQLGDDDPIGLDDDEPLGLGGPAGAHDLTMMVGSDQGPADAPLGPADSADDPFEATLPADSEHARSDKADSADDFGSSGAGSSLADSSLDRTESPSSMQDDNTLAFDSDRRSSDVDTPEALDLTGLDSDGTIPRGPLGEGRASASLKPGDSLVVGEESVRLRVSTIDESRGLTEGGIDFEIVDKVGEGGMGVIYKAKQQSLNRSVAIKQIKSQSASDSDRNKFVSEAVISGQLDHPNIAPVHDLGLAPDGLPFYAMKFLVGEDWGESIKKKSLEENLDVLIQVAQAIAFAHSKRIIHRDLKPDNVWLGSYGEVLLIDWGLAARLDDGSEIQPAGTPIYMPPETALEYLDYAKGRVVGGKKVESSRRRIPAGEHCDIYLLGAVLFKIVTGRAPHRGKSTYDCLRHAAQNEIVKTRRRGELINIAYKAMATEPKERHATATEFVDALKAYQSHAQSILIAKKASSDLREAGKLVEAGAPEATRLYALFASAQNGYKNALELWEGNSKAQRRLARTQRMFAETAYANGDYDLALSLLDEENNEDAELRASIVSAQKSRNARLAWFKTLQYATAASLLLALGFIGLSIKNGNDAFQATARATEQTKIAAEEQRKAAAAKADADIATQDAKAKTEEARLAKLDAEASKQEAGIAKSEAANALKAAAAARTEKAEATALAAQANKDKAAAVKLAEEAAEEAKEQSYYAAIGQVRSALIDDGVFAAWKKLTSIDPAVARIGANKPEWENLVKAVEWRDEATELIGENPAAGARPTFTAASADGGWQVVVAPAGAGSRVAVYRSGEAEPAHEGRVATPPGAVAMDNNGRYVALAGRSLTVYDTQRGETIRTDGASSPATCLAFHPTRAELLVGRTDTSVERWSLAEGTASLLETDGQWHQSAVTAVGYSSDGQQRFSADSTGRLIVWRLDGKAWSDRKAVRHTGAGSPEITAAAMSLDPQGRLAYGCVDGSAYEVAGWWEADLNEDGYADASEERLTTSHTSRVTSVGYARGSDTILTSGGDTILVRQAPLASDSLRSARQTIKKERRYHAAEVLSCTASAEGIVLSSDAQGRVLRWKLDVDPNEDTLAPEGGRGAGVAAIRLQGGASGARLTVADREGFVRSWDDLRRPNAGQKHWSGHADHRDLRAWRLAGPTPRIVTVAADNRACVWHERDGLLQRTINLDERSVVAVDTENSVLYASTDGRPNKSGVPAVAIDLSSPGPATPLWDESPRVASLKPLGENGPRGATLAVGLRDGQVYLWGPRSGRLELVSSSARPHWRPITALTYDPATGRLYSGDRAGLLARWDLRGQTPPREVRLETSTGTIAPVVKIAPWKNDRLIVIRREESNAVATVLDDQLEVDRRHRLQASGLRSIAVDPEGHLVGLRREAGTDRIATWRSGSGWTDVVRSNDRLTGVAATEAGWISWGPGVVEWRPLRNGRPAPASRVVSRPEASALVPSTDRAVKALTRIGTIDQWSALEGEGAQARLGLEGRLTASVVSPGTDTALLALSDAGGLSRIERWSLSKRERLGVIAENQAGVCRVLAIEGPSVVAGFADRIEVLPVRGGRGETIRLPQGTSRPHSLAVASGAETLALATADGSAFLAERIRGDWRVGRLGREDISSVAFTPGGGRLLLGLASGRVLLAEPDLTDAGRASARPLLTFDGHSDPVTVLQVADTQEGARLVSGDDAGRVVVRSL